MSTVLGCDVSSYQGASVNWTAAHAAGIQIAYVQISQGTGVVNPDAQSQIEGARAAGISVGAYHLCYPNLNTPQAEWAFFTSHLGSLPVNLPNMLDDEIEINKAWVLTWLGLSGPLTLHYSDESYLAALGNLGYRQWTARPGYNGLYPGDYATQFASEAFAGFPGSVDLDYFDPAGAGMTEAQMQAFLDGLAQTVSGQSSFAGWMASVLQTEQANFNSLAAIENSVAALGSGGGLTAAQAAQVSAIQADLAALIASLKNA